MGSSVSRKSNDQVYINRPLSASGGTSTGVGGGGASKPSDTNNLCPPAFHAKLTDQNVAVGAGLRVEGRNILLASNPSIVVGRISHTQLRSIQTCAGLGITYLDIHVVADKKGVRHAEFKRS